ncbi:hypothetical protein BC835DRAFT_1265691 [Cytidiella melzeri]|nr:hypothetical protein BC835DRAFT_1265691 [Cytidiella melzeri]
MSKLSTIYPPPLLLQPFVVQAGPVPDPHAVTACIWTWDDGIDSLSSWASRWKGAISLLVATYHPPSSVESKLLVKKLRDMRSQTSVKHKVSIHVLHLAANSSENPNAFLNLARLFAQTDALVLFPGNLSVVPPKVFYRSVASSINSSRPVVFTMRQRTTYPFTPLSPVLLAQENPLWCTERFFPPTSRSMDWSECLWQIWLESFGDVETKPTSDWIQELRPAVNVSAAETRIHRRLSMKYRSETCVLATRQLVALRSSGRDADTIKARWLKRHCREWTVGGREN